MCPSATLVSVHDGALAEEYAAVLSTFNYDVSRNRMITVTIQLTSMSRRYYVLFWRGSVLSGVEMVGHHIIEKSVQLWRARDLDLDLVSGYTAVIRCDTQRVAVLPGNFSGRVF